MLESHFIAQREPEDKSESGKSAQELKIKALDRQLNIELKVKVCSLFNTYESFFGEIFV